MARFPRPRTSTLAFVFAFALASTPPIVAAGAAGPEVRGRILDAGGGPAPSARVELQRIEESYPAARRVLTGGVEPPSIATTTVDAAGRYRLEAPEAGLYRLVVRADGHLPMRREPLLLVSEVELPPVTLLADAGLELRLVGAGGGPAVGGWVSLRDADAELWSGALRAGWRPHLRLARADLDGRLRLPRAAGEAVVVHAFAPDAAETAVPAADLAGGVLHLAPAVHHRLRVVDSAGRPAAGVLASSGPRLWPVAVTEDAGRVTVPGSADAATDLLLLAASGERRRLSLEPESAGAERVVELREELPVDGRVVSARSGEPVPGAVVWPRSEPGKLVRADARGRFRMAVWPAPSAEPSEELHAGAAGHLPATLRVGLGGDPVELALRPVLRGVGWLVDPQDRPIAGGGVAVTRGANHLDAAELDFDHPRAVRTDATGRYTLDQLPAEPFDLHARAAGFAPVTLRGLEPPADATELDLGTLVLVPGSTVLGRVVDPEGRPLPGAEIHALPAGDHRRRADDRPDRDPAATADADGAFAVADLTAGRRVDLRAHLPGYAAVWVEDVEPPAADVRFELEPTARVAGTVVDEAGEPLAGAEVTVRSQPSVPGSGGRLKVGAPVERSARSGPDGTFEVVDVPPGEAAVQATADGFVPGRPEEVEVPAGGVVEDLRLALERGGILEGVVTDAGGEPVAGALVTDGDVVARGDREGHYRLAGVPPGPAEIRAFHPDHLPARAEVDVEAGVQSLDLAMRAGVEVRGRVVDGDGRVVADAAVELSGHRRGEPLEVRATSAADGSFRLAPVAEGDYHLSAHLEGWSPAEPRRLSVGADPIDGLVLELGRGVTIRGRVLGLDFDQLSRVRVTASGASRTAGRTVDGELRYDGEYAVHALGAGDWLLRATLDDGRRQARRRITVDPGVPIGRVDLELTGGLVLTGRVRHGGEPLGGARLSLAGVDVDQERATITRHDGAFRLEDLDPGTYRLGIADPRRFLVHNRSLTLHADRDLEIDLEAGSVDGLVTSTVDGRPIAGALIVLERLLDAPEVTEFIVTGDTGDDGRFDLPRVPAGAYRLTARKDGFAQGEREVTVTDGTRTAGVHLELDPTHGLALDVRLATGGLPETVHLAVLDDAGHPRLAESRGVDDRGRAYFRTVPAGSWRLQVAAPGAAVVETRATVPGEPTAVVLPPAGRLRLRIPALEDSRRTATVHLTTADGRPFRTLELGGRPRESWPAVAGRAEIDGLPAGAWTVHVQDPAGAVWQTTVTTPGSGVVEVMVE